MSKDKKPFSETAVGKFLKEKAPHVLDVVKDAIPDKGIIGFVKNILLNDSRTSEDVKKEFNEREAEFELNYEKEITARQISEDTNVTERWKTDMQSDSWMSKNSRPLTLLSLLGFLYIIILADSIEAWQSFTVKDAYIDLLQILLTTVVVAYFGGRSYEKGQSMKKK